MTGDVALVRATKAVDSLFRSSSHGTGRRMSRSECRPMADAFDFEALRRAVLLPAGLHGSSLRTEGPYAYRDLHECIGLSGRYVEIVSRFAVVGDMGHF